MSKQKFFKIVQQYQLEVDVADYLGLQITVFAPNGFRFASGHSIASQVYYTCKGEIWKELLERLSDELPLVVCKCDDCSN